MKRILISLGVVAVVIITGVIFLAGNLNSIVVSVVERVGSDVTGVDVALDDADIKPTQGTGMLSELTVGNPPGFETDAALRIGSISISIDTSTVTSDPIVINEIVIDRPQVTYELARGGNNIDVIKRDIDAYSAANAAADSDKGAAGREAARKVIIDNIYIRDGEVRVSAKGFSGRSQASALPYIHLTDIGRESGGATAGEVAKQIVGAIMRGTTRTVADLDLVSILQGIGVGAEGIGELTGSAIGKGGEAAGSILKGVGGAVEDGADRVGGAIRGVFGD